MRQAMIIVIATYVVVSAVALTGCGKAGEDTLFDKLGDRVATIGKPEGEATMIVAQRQTKRAALRIQAGMKEAADDMNRQMKSAFGK